MKFLAPLALLLFPLALHAGAIIQRPLDEFVIAEVPTASKSGTTTIMFPGEISGLYAKSVAVQEQENAGFQISFTPGNFYFSIRALRPDAEDHLTVIFERKTYVLHLTASEKPLYALTFFREGRVGKEGGRGAVLPERLLSLLDRAKAYPLLAKERPDALAGVLHAAPEITNYYDDFTVRVRDVWRFEAEDTLVFRLEFENATDAAIAYNPQDLAVRIEERIYTQSIADASGVMPPRSVTPAFFAITGDGQGGRNHLAPTNPWNVLVIRADSQPQTSASAAK